MVPRSGPKAVQGAVLTTRDEPHASAFISLAQFQLKKRVARMPFFCRRNP
jgi:hypothetical protein